MRKFAHLPEVPVNVDLFLARYYRVAERARSPRCVSVEANVRGGFEGAVAAEDWRLLALGVMARAERAGLTIEHQAVLSTVYLRLGQEHIEILKRDGELVARELDAGEAAEPAASVGTMTSWRQVALVVWGKRSGALEAKAKRLWKEGRATVARASPSTTS